MKRLLITILSALAVPAVIAAPAQAAQPEPVARHVDANHGGGSWGPSGNDRASTGPGWFFGKFTKCEIYVLNPDAPSCGPLAP